MLRKVVYVQVMLTECRAMSPLKAKECEKP